MKKLVKLFAILTFLGATGVFYGCGETSSQMQVFDTKETYGPTASIKAAESPRMDTKEEGKEVPKETTTTENIYVYVCGQVKKPGVYTVKPGARINDVIALAGGLTKDASDTSINLAKNVSDEEQIYVPSKKEAESEAFHPAEDNSNAAAESRTEQSSGKININIASKQELMSLAGIGESKATSIISYRETNGSFTSIEDIMKIDGIKTGVFNKIKDNITV